MSIPHNPFAAPLAVPLAAAERPQLVGRFVAWQAIVWVIAAPVLGVAVARLAVWVQNFRSPLVIFPLLVGVGLGLLLVGVMRLGQVGHRATLWSGAVLAVAVAVVGQHYMLFKDEADCVTKKLEAVLPGGDKDMLPARYTDFAQFMRWKAASGREVNVGFKLPIEDFHLRLRGAAAWVSWAFDGLLTLFATVAIVYFACRAPYCSVCRSWYRTIRAGPLTAERARRIADAASLPVEGPLGEGRYRLSHCASGCGPTRLQLAVQPRTKVMEAWLPAARRELVVRVLDGTG